MSKQSKVNYDERPRYWAYILLVGFVGTFLSLILGDIFFPDWRWELDGGGAISFAIMAATVGAEGIFAPIYAWLNDSPTLQGGSMRFTMSHREPVELPPQPMAAIDREMLDPELTEKDRTRLYHVAMSTPGADVSGQPVPAWAYSLQGGDAWGLKSLDAFRTVMVVYGKWKVIRSGELAVVPFGLEPHSQSAYPPEYWAKLVDPKTRPRGFKLGVRGSKVYSPGAKLLPEWEEWVANCPAVHSAVANRWGFDGMGARFIEEARMEAQKQGIPPADPKFYPFVANFFKVWLQSQPHLRVAVGGGDADIQSIDSQRFSLQTSLNQARAELLMSERQVFKLRAMNDSLIDRKARMVRGKGVSLVRTPSEHIIEESTQGREG